MYPWLWLWAPRLQFPWSGNVAQDIEPSTSWFFAGIDPRAGNARIEEQAFGIASYGKQLGLITDVLIELADAAPSGNREQAKALAELKRIRSAIEKLKDVEYDRELRELQERVQVVQRRGGKRAAALTKRLLGAGSSGEA